MDLTDESLNFVRKNESNGQKTAESQNVVRKNVHMHLSSRQTKLSVIFSYPDDT